MFFVKLKEKSGFLAFFNTLLFILSLVVASIAGPVIIGVDNNQLFEKEKVERYQK